MLDKARSRLGLTGDLPTWPGQESLTLRSLADVGRGAFEAVLAEVVAGDPDRAAGSAGMLDEAAYAGI